MDIKTLIVDDEPLARERLRNFLSAETGILLLGECASGDEALNRIRNDSPDLVWLDIQMPGLNGFDLLERLGPDIPQAVVFCTAYDQFAIRAFEVHAVDYLLKPFERDRFRTALHRALERIASRKPADWHAQLRALLGDLKPAARLPDRLAVKTAGKVVLLGIDEIDWIGSADNYVELHVGPRSHLLRETMNSISARLPEDRFVRISRTTIVNLARVKELHPLFHGEYSVILQGGARLTLSRSHREQLGRLGLNQPAQAETVRTPT